MLPSRFLNKTRMIVTNSDIELAKEIITSNKFIYKLKAGTRQDRRAEFRYERFVDELLKIIAPNGSSYISNDLKSCAFWLTPSMKASNLELFFALRRSTGLFMLPNIWNYRNSLMKHNYEKNSCYLFLWGHNTNMNKRVAADTILTPMLKYNDENKIYTYTDCVKDADLYIQYGFTEDGKFLHESDTIKILKRNPIAK